MASSQQVRAYLAHWFQLGKPVILDNGRSECLPRPIFGVNGYSGDFEACWQRILQYDGVGCYIRGTQVEISDLLSPAWEIGLCPRCPMPIALTTGRSTPDPCPCHDVPSWPNDQTPVPRLVVDNRKHLSQLRERLAGVRGQALQGKRQAYAETPEVAKVFEVWRETAYVKKS